MHASLTATGRTARIGNEGLATSFYNEKDEALGPFLTKILMETNQEIPDFLAGFKLEGDLNFDDEEEEQELDDTAIAAADVGGNAWGTVGDTGAATVPAVDAWGADEAAAAPVENGWGMSNVGAAW